MKGKIIFSSFDESLECFYTDVSIGMNPYDYEISIKVPLDKSYEEIISDPLDFEDSINLSLDIISDNEKQVKILEAIKKDRIHYLSNAEDIVFYYSPKEVAEFVRKNSILATKRIVFEDKFDLNPKLLNEVITAFGDKTDNIYFQIDGNDNIISFKEYKATIETINGIVDKIKSYNFSPLEKIMYVYDLVRDKVYVEADKDEDKMISRNLSSALLGNKIVCVGYAVIFKTLLEKLSIECREVRLMKPGKNIGHARDVIFVKDDKYNVHGVYYFDPTWDNKKNELDNNFLYSYRYFAMTKKKMNEIDNGNLKEDSFLYYSDNMALEFKTLVEMFGLENIPDDFRKSVNQMSFLTGGDILINKGFMYEFIPVECRLSVDEIYEELVKLEKYFNKPISGDTLLKVLMNVRKQQYYANPEKYPFELIDFYKTVYVSEWNFKGVGIENLMLKLARSPKEKCQVMVEQSMRVADENNMPEEIEQVRLTRTLRNIYEQKR